MVNNRGKGFITILAGEKDSRRRFNHRHKLEFGKLSNMADEWDTPN